MYPSPNQANSVKWINRIGRLLSAVSINQPSLNIDKLLQAATHETGLSDFGDPGFRDGLAVLVESLEKEANLSQLGRLSARGMIVNNLIARLQITDYRKQHPEVANKPVTRPLIVVGLPRTGTTILFELLAQDPDFRSPLTWEIERPMPPPRPETFHSDPRIAEVEKSTRQADGLAPEFKAIHETGAALPQECVSILASHFSSEQFSISFNIPTYRAWALSNDMQAAYQWHNIFLQHLQADHMKQRWLLKAPVHIGYLDTLFAQYPDACVVQTHREPMDVIGSVSSLACTLRSAFSDVINPVKTGPEEAAFFAELLNRGMQQRDALNIEQQFFDLQFKDIITDPVSAIRSMYEYFDLELTQEKADAIQHYLDNRPRDKHGKHKYTLAQFGLSEERHGPLFDEYRARYIK